MTRVILIKFYCMRPNVCRARLGTCLTHVASSDSIRPRGILADSHGFSFVPRLTCSRARSSKNASRPFGFSYRRQFAGNEIRVDDMPSNGNVVSRDSTQKSYFRFFEDRFTVRGTEDGGSDNEAESREGEGGEPPRGSDGNRFASIKSRGQINVYECRVIIDVMESRGRELGRTARKFDER